MHLTRKIEINRARTPRVI